jgi:hypothetical protein
VHQLRLFEMRLAVHRTNNPLLRKAAALFEKNADLTHTDMVVLGAVQRTLAQSRGFRKLIKTKNFPCAAAILRMQLDTGMRINALRIVENRNQFCEQILKGTRFNLLKDSAGIKMTDAHLRKKLSEDHPWISAVYEQTSDFVHLSGRHFYSSIFKMDDDTSVMTLAISGADQERPEESYFEIVDAFFTATKLVATLLLGCFLARSGLLEPKTPQLVEAIGWLPDPTSKTIIGGHEALAEGQRQNAP